MANYNIHFDWNRISTLGKVKILVEQVVGSPSQEAINTAVEDYIEAHPGSLSPLSPAVKSALLQIAEKVAYIDANGQDYYDALDAALNAKALLSITAVYTQSGTVYDTDSLDSLKADLVVTAYYDDGTSAVVSSGYTLSGELTVGTSTVTVTYSGKTTTFTVTVTGWDYQWTPSSGTLDQAGFTFTKNSGSITYESDGAKIVGVDNATTAPVIANPIDATHSAQVMEYVISFESFPEQNQSNCGFGLNVMYNGSAYVLFRAGSTYGTGQTTYGQYRWSNVSGVWNDLTTPQLSKNTDYTVTVTYHSDGNFVVELDGTQIFSVESGTRTSSTANRFHCLAGTYKLKALRVRTA